MMRRVYLRPPSRSLKRSALVVLAAGVAAGCSSDATRLSEGPLFAGSTANQRAIIAGSQVSAGVQPVQSAALAPAGRSYAPDPTATGAGVARGQWTTVGAPVVTLQAGETLTLLAQRHGVPVDVIVAANRLPGPEAARPGQALVIPTYVYRDAEAAVATPLDAGPEGIASGPRDLGQLRIGAEEAARTPDAVAVAPQAPAGGASAAGGTHIVQPGETLWQVARIHDVSPAALMAANGVGPDYKVKAGERLRLPGGSTALASASGGTDDDATREPAATASAEPAAAEPKPVEVASVASGAVRAGATMTDATAAAGPDGDEKAAEAPADDGVRGFRWPARGRIVAGFGKQANGERNDGINLALPAGTPVKAAEQGTVIYAGNELPGYGNLVLIQHEGGWVTAYAHNEVLKVKRGDKVRRGQVISTVGSTGSVSQPQLHFELRKGSKPVDPLPHLSGA